MVNYLKTKAFTLAEILITLAIIGIVAALTIPSLIQNYKAVQLKSQLQKAYSLLNQAIQMEYAETGIPVTPEQYLLDRKFYKVLMKHLKVAKNCDLNSCVTWNPDSVSVINDYLIYSRKDNVKTYFFDDGQFIALDGSVIMVENPHDNVNGLLVTIDINGINHKPNAWGQDVFTFEVTDKGLLPSGAKGTTWDFETHPHLCSPTGTNSQNGLACTDKALNEPDYFKNLP